MSADNTESAIHPSQYPHGQFPIACVCCAECLKKGQDRRLAEKGSKRTVALYSEKTVSPQDCQLLYDSYSTMVLRSLRGGLQLGPLCREAWRSRTAKDKNPNLWCMLDVRSKQFWMYAWSLFAQINLGCRYALCSLKAIWGVCLGF